MTQKTDKESDTSRPIMKKRIYIDMDDTLCHCTSAMQLALSQADGLKWPQSQHGFFRNLAPINGACEAVVTLSKTYDVWILTRPSTRNRLCYTEKADWVFQYLGQEWVDKLILCPDKALMKGELLIDDKLWEGFEGAQILFGVSPYSSWSDVLYAIYSGRVKF